MVKIIIILDPANQYLIGNSLRINVHLLKSAVQNLENELYSRLGQYMLANIIFSS